MKSKRREDAGRVRYMKDFDRYMRIVDSKDLEGLEHAVDNAPFTDKTKELYRLSSYYADRKNALSGGVQSSQKD